MKNVYDQFIYNKKDKNEYYHIYFNNNKKEEIKRTNLIEKDNVSKINIIIDYQVKSLINYFGIVNVLNL